MLGVVFYVSNFYSTKGLNKVIYIDPGHGGIDGGSISNEGVYEKTVVLSIGHFLKEYLELNGYEVMMTRLGDYDLADLKSTNRKRDDILRRVEMINKSNCDVTISIHANAFPNKNIKGAQCFYNDSSYESKLLSDYIQKRLNECLKNDRISMGIKNKYILDNVIYPIVLIEVGFLSNKDDANNLSNPDYQKMIAYIIGNSIIDFLNE